MATRFGWACGAPGGRPAYGSVLLSGRERPARYAGFLDWLDDAARVHKPARIVAEAPLASGDFAGRDAALLALGFGAHLEMWAWDRSIPLEMMHAGTVRKQVLGRGTFPKGEAKGAVIEWARREGFEPGDDNAADALLLWHAATGQRAQGALRVVA